MEAVAHNPTFAKKAGVPQSVGKDFSAADKGRKFQKGGATMMGKKVPGAMSAMMARRRMGAGMPPPPQPPAPMGMKKGGKVRRFEEGGATEGQNPRIDDDTRARALAFVAKNEPSTTKYSDEEEGGGKSFTSKVDKKPPVAKPKNKFSNAKFDTSPTRPTYRPIRNNADAAIEYAKGYSYGPKDYETPGNKAERLALDKDPELAKAVEEENKRNPPMKSPTRLATRTSNPITRSTPEMRPTGKSYFPMKKGGLMKFAKGGMAHGGMHKMPDGKMMKNSAMKKDGMPMKDGKPAFMMGKKMNMGGMARMKEGGMPMKDGKPAFLMGKKMNMGGMAKYAKGGGIESRGKTKGTMIRMAAGGSVSSRADGIAQRGKTRG